MCGIIGYIGPRLAVPILLEGLKAQEYRGYDSAGVAVLENDEIRLIRSQGKIAMLEERIGGEIGSATIGIGHTRWATHGRPSDINSHPHLDCKNEIAMVHNVIIENYVELREWLTGQGHVFASQTDTEVLPHLMEHYYCGDLVEAMTRTVERLQGSYATVALCKHEPRKLVAARRDNPLIIGLGEGEYFFASDMAALIQYTRDVLILQNGDIALITEEGVTLYNDGKRIQREIHHIDWDRGAAQKGGYEHFMLKEINEQPWALGQTLKGRISGDASAVDLKELDFSPEYLKSIQKIAIVACGTAYHAGLVGKNIMEKMLRLPVEVDVASEFQTRDPLVDRHTLSIIISQSGETLDTLIALRECRKRGSKIVAICNVVDSTIAREADYVLYTWAGPEIAVASTKAYITQLMVIYMLTFYLAQHMGKSDHDELRSLISQLYRVPEAAQLAIDMNDARAKELSLRMKDQSSAFFIGRGMDHCVALEGALKLKEISYIHAEAYAAGELKHGTIALIEKDVVVLALTTQSALQAKMISNIQELQSRDAFVIGVTMEENEAVSKVCDTTLFLPQIDEHLAPILSVIPMQLFAYYCAVVKDCNVDQPRNLAKSVTVL
ncbi:MAG: glutamine--fructose-6-phosphate transaminase (isomerizing) [Bacillota bacterium]|nr:glutamine--fructose-6-phosphate transaminase (isomerizing) [Bacillota bacterium]